MTEILRYSLLAKEDMRTEPRGGTFEATLADGRVVNLHAVDVAHFLGDAYATASVPDQDTGQIYRLTDGIRGLWGINQRDFPFPLNGGVINAREFIPGDGGAGDIAAFADIFAVSGAKTVVFPGPYTYRTDGVIIDDDDTTVIVQAGAVIKRSDTVGNNYVFAVIANRVSFLGGGVIDGNSAVLQGSQNLSLISLNHGDIQTADIEDILIFGLTFRNSPNITSGQTGDGIRTPLHTETFTVRDVRIIGNAIRDMARNGITLTNAQYVEVVGNSLTDCPQSGIDLEGTTAALAVKYASIMNNTYRNTGAIAGRGIDGGANHSVIKGNIIDSGTATTPDGIRVTGGEDVLVEGNYIHRPGIGIVVTNNVRARIRGNTIHSANAQGITTASANTEITGNSIYNWNQAGGSNRVAIQVTAGGFAYIAENTINKETGGTSSGAIGLGSTGNNRVGRNHYVGDILTRVANRVASDILTDNLDIVAKTAQYTVSAGDDFGKTFTNVAATGVFEFDLPASVVGLRYSFIRVASFAVRVDPNGVEVIRGGAAGKYLELDTDGDSVTLLCVAAGTWEIVAINGTVAYEA